MLPLPTMLHTAWGFSHLRLQEQGVCVQTIQPLRMLSYQYNQIEHMDHVESLPELAFLDFYANCLTSLQGLAPLKSLRVLMLGRNRLSHLSGTLWAAQNVQCSLKLVYSAQATAKHGLVHMSRALFCCLMRFNRVFLLICTQLCKI